MEKEQANDFLLLDRRLPGTSLIMELQSACVEIHCWDEKDISIQAFQDGGSRPSFSVMVEEVDKVVRVQDHMIRRFWLYRRRLSYIVAVPKDMAINIRAHQGDVRIQGIQGPLKIRLDGGNILLHDICGTLDLETREGSVSLTNGAISNALIRTGNGSIDLQGVAYGLNLASQSGDIRVCNAQNGQLTVTIGNGSFTYSGGLDPSNSNNLVRVIAGNVNFHLLPESDLRVAARTTSGSITSSFELSDVESSQNLLQGVIGQGGTMLQINVATGNIAIDRHERVLPERSVPCYERDSGYEVIIRQELARE